MVVIEESIPSSNLMLPLVSIAHLVRWFTTDVWRTSPNRSSSCWMVTLWLQVGTPRSWFKRTISLTTWYNVILHVHAVVMIVMMQLLSLSTFSLRSQAKFIHLPARLISWSSHVGVWWFCMVFVSLFTNVWQDKAEATHTPGAVGSRYPNAMKASEAQRLSCDVFCLDVELKNVPNIIKEILKSSKIR